jgi:hypothetical protein
MSDFEMDAVDFDFCDVVTFDRPFEPSSTSTLDAGLGNSSGMFGGEPIDDKNVSKYISKPDSLFLDDYSNQRHNHESVIDEDHEEDESDEESMNEEIMDIELDTLDMGIGATMFTELLQRKMDKAESVNDDSRGSLELTESPRVVDTNDHQEEESFEGIEDNADDDNNNDEDDDDDDNASIESGDEEKYILRNPESTSDAHGVDNDDNRPDECKKENILPAGVEKACADVCSTSPAPSMMDVMNLFSMNNRNIDTSSSFAKWIAKPRAGFNPGNLKLSDVQTMYPTATSYVAAKKEILAAFEGLLKPADFNTWLYVHTFPKGFRSKDTEVRRARKATNSLVARMYMLFKQVGELLYGLEYMQAMQDPSRCVREPKVAKAKKRKGQTSNSGEDLLWADMVPLMPPEASSSSTNTSTSPRQKSRRSLSPRNEARTDVGDDDSMIRGGDAKGNEFHVRDVNVAAIRRRYPFVDSFVADIGNIMKELQGRLSESDQDVIATWRTSESLHTKVRYQNVQAKLKTWFRKMGAASFGMEAFDKCMAAYIATHPARMPPATRAAKPAAPTKPPTLNTKKPMKDRLQQNVKSDNDDRQQACAILVQLDREGFDENNVNFLGREKAVSLKTILAKTNYDALRKAYPTPEDYFAHKHTVLNTIRTKLPADDEAALRFLRTSVSMDNCDASSQSIIKERAKAVEHKLLVWFNKMGIVAYGQDAYYKYLFGSPRQQVVKRSHCPQQPQLPAISSRQSGSQLAREHKIQFELWGIADVVNMYSLYDNAELYVRSRQTIISGLFRRLNKTQHHTLQMMFDSGHEAEMKNIYLALSVQYERLGAAVFGERSFRAVSERVAVMTADSTSPTSPAIAACKREQMYIPNDPVILCYISAAKKSEVQRKRKLREEYNHNRNCGVVDQGFARDIDGDERALKRVYSRMHTAVNSVSSSSAQLSSLPEDQLVRAISHILVQYALEKQTQVELLVGKVVDAVIGSTNTDDNFDEGSEMDLSQVEMVADDPQSPLKATLDDLLL